MSMPAAAVGEHGMGTTGAPDLGKRRLPMVHKLAYKNLFYDRLSLTVTLVGIVFSVVLVAVQLGMYEGTERLVTSVIDKAPADMWVVPIETKSFDDPFPLTGREKQAILSTPGVAKVNEMLVSFVNWKKPSGGMTTASIVGLDDLPNSPLPWDIEQGSKQSILAPSGVVMVETTAGAPVGPTIRHPPSVWREERDTTAQSSPATAHHQRRLAPGVDRTARPGRAGPARPPPFPAG